MRLYRLLARLGTVKKGISPFVEAPPEVEPGKFAGWQWNAEEGRWEKVPLKPIKVSFPYKLYPKPEQLPSRAFSAVQPGWSYSFTTNEWVQTKVMAEPIEFVPPHLMPPGTEVTEACALAAGQSTLTLMMDKFIAMGLPGDQAFDLATRINTVKVRHMVVSPTGEYYKLWDGYSNVMGREGMTFLQQVTVGMVLMVIIDDLRLMIDAIGRGLMWPKEKIVRMVPIERTYLFGPDEWFYADHVSVSPKDVPYYTACEEIGATNAHHLRGHPGAWDRIAFEPGGFLEKGWKAGRFVRYRWEYWEVNYIGFLIRSGENFYRLQVGYEDRDAYRAGYMKPYGQVCAQKFRYYL